MQRCFISRFKIPAMGSPNKILTRSLIPFLPQRVWVRGSGLGLSVSHSIIEQHEGRIDVESIPGEKTKITVILPSKEH